MCQMKSKGDYSKVCNNALTGSVPWLCRVPHGSVVKCLAHNPEVLRSSRTGFS